MSAIGFIKVLISLYKNNSCFLHECVKESYGIKTEYKEKIMSKTYKKMSNSK